MVQHLMTSGAKNLEDLELIQLVSVGEAVSLQTLQSKNFRLKTFSHGWVADEAIEEGWQALVHLKDQGKVRHKERLASIS